MHFPLHYPPCTCKIHFRRILSSSTPRPVYIISSFQRSEWFIIQSNTIENVPRFCLQKLQQYVHAMAPNFPSIFGHSTVFFFQKCPVHANENRVILLHVYMSRYVCNSTKYRIMTFDACIQNTFCLYSKIRFIPHYLVTILKIPWLSCQTRWVCSVPETEVAAAKKRWKKL